TDGGVIVSDAGATHVFALAGFPSPPSELLNDGGPRDPSSRAPPPPASLPDPSSPGLLLLSLPHADIPAKAAIDVAPARSKRERLRKTRRRSRRMWKPPRTKGCTRFNDLTGKPGETHTPRAATYRHMKG